MADAFPGVGHHYRVDFGAFRVELHFISETSMTYAGIRSDGSTGTPVPVTIAIRPIRDQLFLVTWQEADSTTVVHLEDYKENTIVTHITTPGDEKDPSLKFLIFQGTMTQVAN
jgi:molybdenum cofactor biosynthesis MoaF-like protein